MQMQERKANEQLDIFRGRKKCPENEVDRLENYPLHKWKWILNATHAFTSSSKAKLEGKIGWYAFQKYRLSSEYI